jgi:hypothetical protein
LRLGRWRCCGFWLFRHDLHNDNSGRSLHSARWENERPFAIFTIVFRYLSIAWTGRVLPS